MEKLKPKYLNFIKACTALDKSINILRALPAETSSDMRDVVIAGVIKHFELAYETCWKYLKIYLDSKCNIQIASPKETFRACYSNNILPLEVTDSLLELADDRNLTVHIYDQLTAVQICESIEKHRKAFLEITKLLP